MAVSNGRATAAADCPSTFMDRRPCGTVAGRGIPVPVYFIHFNPGR
ncbi:hypothetical protein [Desulfoplanes sp.]